MKIPSSSDELTPAWFSEVLDADIGGVDVVDAHSGTTGRALVRLSTSADLPETLFVKLQPVGSEQQDLVRQMGMGVAEARFYASVGDDFPVLIPRAWHAAYDESDHSFIMVLEDLVANGGRFLAATDDDILETAHAQMDELAILHAHHWGQRLPWAKGPSGYRSGGEGAQVAARATAIMQSAIDQFAADLPPAFRELAELHVKRFSDIYALYGRGERTLIHGDNHIGNLFMKDGRTGFYDWAVVSHMPGMRDVSYFLANSLSAEARRAEGAALVARYRAGLSDRGITLDAQTAEQQYRLYAVYSWMGATTTAAMGSRWQPAEVGYAAMVSATEAIADLDSVGLLNELLAAG